MTTDEMQCRFMPGCGTTNPIFILRQLQDKYRAKKKNLYFAFVDLEKVLDRISKDVSWWALRTPGVGPGEHIKYLTDGCTIKQSEHHKYRNVFPTIVG